MAVVSGDELRHLHRRPLVEADDDGVPLFEPVSHEIDRTIERVEIAPQASRLSWIPERVMSNHPACPTCGQSILWVTTRGPSTHYAHPCGHQLPPGYDPTSNNRGDEP